MRLPLRQINENLVDYSIKLSDYFATKSSIENRSQNGQFFTPREISNFMCDLISIKNDKIKILDPCSGTGILIASFCQKLINSKEIKDNLEISIDAYERDTLLFSLLEKLRIECVKDLKLKGIKCTFQLFKKDYVLENSSKYFQTIDDELNDNLDYYDYIIANPPYYQFKKNSFHSKSMMELVYGKPNIYSLFLCLSALMLNKNGSLVYIVPRSFCSGLYYKKIRNFILKNLDINFIHSFNQRKIFSNVQQETIIIKGKYSRNLDYTTNVTISNSEDASFANSSEIQFRKSDIIYQKNGNKIISIPLNKLDHEVITSLEKISNSISDLNLQLRVGQVVPFRSEKYLEEPIEVLREYPLFWMENINTEDFNLTWPLEKRKEKVIYDNEIPDNLLIPVENFVLIRRFSSKDQKRRIIASILFRKDFISYEKIGFENHIIYISGKSKKLTQKVAFGLAGYLSTKLVDSYFRTINGSTQINKFDLVNLPLPSLNQIKSIGSLLVTARSSFISKDIEYEIAKILNIDKEIIAKLYKNQ